MKTKLKIYTRNKNRLSVAFVKNQSYKRIALGLKDSPEARKFIEANASYIMSEYFDKKEFILRFKEYENSLFDKDILKQNKKAFLVSKKLLQRQDYIISVIEKYKQSKRFLTKNSKKFYENSVKKMLDFFQKENIKTISEIKSEHAMAFALFLIENKIKRSTLNVYLVAYRNFLNFCLDHDLVEKLPYKKPSFSKNYFNQEKKEKAFSLDEIKQILLNCEDLELKAYLKIAFFTGMRTGEILALKESDLDFEKELIHIKAHLHTSGHQSHTKTKTSTRDIIMLEPVKEALQWLITNKNTLKRSKTHKGVNYLIPSSRIILQIKCESPNH